MLSCFGREGNYPHTQAFTYTKQHTRLLLGQVTRFPVTCYYLAFSGLGWTAPHETLINNPQVLLPVVHFEAVDMGAACGTHDSHSIRLCCPLGDETCSNPSTQTRSERAGWLASLPGSLFLNCCVLANWPCPGYSYGNKSRSKHP